MLTRLFLVTFSGAHATGKTTLIEDTRAVLADRERSVFVVPSCSSTLFARIQSGQVRVPTDRRPQDYDDLDRLGLRGFFQRQLPDVLASVTLLALLDAPPVETRTAYLFVDRWFPDICAYTLVESRDPALRASVSERCLCAHDDLLLTLQSHAQIVSMLNVFLPVALAPAASTPDKFQATCDREAWERECLANWKKAARERRGLLVVTKKSRTDRVNEVLERLGDPPITELAGAS